MSHSLEPPSVPSDADCRLQIPVTAAAPHGLGEIHDAGILVADEDPRVALTHHERWDGSGYPVRLAGKNIPIESRMVAVADVFDALETKRPYKPAFPLQKRFEIMREGRGTQFDPMVIDAFFRCRDIVQIQIDFADVD